MTHSGEAAGRTLKPVPAAPMRALHPLLWGVRECIAAAFWLFLFTKLLVFDVDVVILGSWAPRFAYLLNYRLFLIVGGLALLWLILGNRRFRSFVAYVLFYPLVVLLWKLPKMLFRNWAVLLVFAPAVHSFLTTFRARFITTALALMASLTLVASHNVVLLSAAALTMLLILLDHYRRRFRTAFQPTTAFSNIGILLRRLWTDVLEGTLSTQIAEAATLEPGSEDYAKKRFENLQSLFLFNLSFQFLAVKVREVVNSHRIDLYFVVSLLHTFMLTVVGFAFLFFAIHKIAPASFEAEDGASFWKFLAYSFSTLMTADFPLVRPKASLAIVASQVELVCSVLIVVILVFLIMTSIRERYREDLNSVIEELAKHAGAIERLMQTEYQLSVSGVEAQVLAHNPNFAHLVKVLRRPKTLGVASD